MNKSNNDYTINKTYWIYQINYSLYKTIFDYNHGKNTLCDLEPEYSDQKYDEKKIKIIPFPKDNDISKGDFILIYLIKQSGTTKQGVMCHLKAKTNCLKNSKYKVSKDESMQKFYIEYESHYNYEKCFKLNEFKSSFNKNTPVKSPLSFTRKYTNQELYYLSKINILEAIFLLKLFDKKYKHEPYKIEKIKLKFQNNNKKIEKKSNEEKKISKKDDDEDDDENDDEDDDEDDDKDDDVDDDNVNEEDDDVDDDMKKMMMIIIIYL